jgi:hypothetical protein
MEDLMEKNGHKQTEARDCPDGFAYGLAGEGVARIPDFLRALGIPLEAKPAY